MLLIIGGSCFAIVLDQVYVEANGVSFYAFVVEIHNFFIDCVVLVGWDASNELSEAHQEGLHSLFVQVCWV